MVRYSYFGKARGSLPQHSQDDIASAWSMTDGVISFMTGLAPEIPEDLYMLIKKVASFSYSFLFLLSNYQEVHWH